MKSSVIALIALLAVVETAGAQNVPTGFMDELVVSGISQPVGMGFAPDGRLFVNAKDAAQIWVCLTNGQKQMIGTVPSVNTGSERGLLGVCVDPNFPASPYIYVNYTRTNGLTVSRYTITGPDLNNPNGTNLSLGARYEVVTGLPDANFNHNGGTVRFGTDGMLLASFGDDDGTHCAAAATVGNGRGEIFRMDVSGLPAGAGGPPSIASITPSSGNPGSWGSQPTGSWAPLVWAQGFRNPFRFNVDDIGASATGNLYIADVGEVSWEELDEAPAGSSGLHFGSPWWEGNAAWMSCAGYPAPPPVTFPIATISHSTGAGAIMSMPRYRNVTGGAFNFGSSYEGDVFYTDYYNGVVQRLKYNGSSWAPAPAVPGQPAGGWATGYAGLSDAVMGPFDGAIYYCDHTGGQVRRIRSNANAPMLNVVSGNNQIGTQGQMLPLPLKVQLMVMGVPQTGTTVTWSANTGNLSATTTVTDTNGFTEVFYTLDPTSSAAPTITASVPNGIPAIFNATWRGLSITYLGAVNLAIVSFRHSQANAPVTIAFDVPHPNPLIFLPWGDIWVDFFTPSPAFGTLIDGMGLFGPPTAGSTTTATASWSAVYSNLPPLGGITVAFQGFGVDTSLLPANNAIIISDKVEITFN